eukprot:TRINITY_DN22783_c0_g1_i1.p1 TRINITY_DN22783_c0_g1~~TRINITY_DN22783_c0_g1_i1.p1  ORF type:complete len:693 (+),score=175.82 TRINITY_DN22783_c0_g1_i1:51-2129(+)
MKQDMNSPKGLKSVSNSIAVMIRCRPFNKREGDWFERHNKPATPVIEMDGNTVTVLDPDNDYAPKDAFSYHNCYWSCNGHDSPNGMAGQTDVYETTGKVLLGQALEGYNGCVFAYGQTGSGKTYSMLGAPGQPGLSYLLIGDLFKHIEAEKVSNPGAKYVVNISFMEIYNEQVRDLFNKKIKAGEYSAVKIRQHPLLGIQVEGLMRVTVSNALECEKQMERGVSERALAETKMNATSSRSHAICQICIEQVNAQTGLRRGSLINLVDLAGSERLKMTGASGTQLTEAKNINQSLSTLRKVFDVLIDNSKKKTKAVPPYRESMLTWVLKESLGGNSRTMMIAAVSPCEESIEDTISTLRYAQKAKAIVCKVIQNEQPNAKMVSNLKGQVEDLKKQLEEQLQAGNVANAETIRQEYAEQIQSTELALKEAEATEIEMKEKQQQLEKEKERLEADKLQLREDKLRIQADMHSHKKQKFTAAFRSAFVIKKDKTELKNLEEQLRKSSEELMMTRKHLSGVENDLKENQRMLKEATVSCGRTSKALDTKTEILKQMTDERNDLQAKYEMCRCPDLRLRVKELEKELAEARGKNKRCESALRETSTRGERLEADLSKAQRESSKVRAELDVCKREFDTHLQFHAADKRISEALGIEPSSPSYSPRRLGSPAHSPRASHLAASPQRERKSAIINRATSL